MQLTWEEFQVWMNEIDHLLLLLSDTLSVLARTIGNDVFSPLAAECVQLGLNLTDTIDDPDLRRCTYVNKPVNAFFFSNQLTRPHTSTHSFYYLKREGIMVWKSKSFVFCNFCFTSLCPSPCQVQSILCCIHSEPWLPDTSPHCYHNGHAPRTQVQWRHYGINHKDNTAKPTVCP